LASFVPLAIGSIAAGIVGTLVGTLLGLGAFNTFFLVVIPIMAGGIGEGAIPLSVGYAEILGQPPGDMFALVLPPVMLGSLTAILLAGTLNFVGKRYPALTGEGRLQPGEHDEMDTAKQDAEDEAGAPIDVGTVAAAGLTAITLYLLGIMCHRLFGLPAPEETLADDCVARAKGA
jgi:Na+/citrate or Na+/malate symporter